ncbi:MAG: hypothetical protein HRO68_08160 [Nitrosopumilus sp.]|nr:hypothetical protein [Nitrosopumilus sp.]
MIPILVSGWKVYDNKGRTIEQYENFYSNSLKFEPETTIGQKIQLEYDALGRLTKKKFPDDSKELYFYETLDSLEKPSTIHPNSWEKHIYDQNDNSCETLKEISDELKKHCNTPVSIIYDVFGREISKIKRNGKEEKLWRATYSEYDAKGNLILIRGHDGRKILSNVYDLNSNSQLLKSFSPDKGTNFRIFDAVENIIEIRDERNALTLIKFDTLNRPIKIWARNNQKQKITLREMKIYGDNFESSGISEKQAKQLNMINHIYKHYDEAGLVVFQAEYIDKKPYDFKENIVDKIRFVFSDDFVLKNSKKDEDYGTFEFDWNDPQNLDESEIFEEGYRTSMQYDA